MHRFTNAFDSLACFLSCVCGNLENRDEIGTACHVAANPMGILLGFKRRTGGKSKTGCNPSNCFRDDASEPLRRTSDVRRKTR
jgi:hypothetical protein